MQMVRGPRLRFLELSCIENFPLSLLNDCHGRLIRFDFHLIALAPEEITIDVPFLAEVENISVGTHTINTLVKVIEYTPKLNYLQI